MVVGGRMMWKHCPKHINGMLGYRTTRSRKNMDTWKFAHDYCGKLWWKIGWVMIIPSALVHIPLYHSDENTIGVAGGNPCNNSMYYFDCINLSDRASFEKKF